MQVKDVMHRGAEWAPADTSLLELARIMRDENIGCVPIGEKDRLIGMVTDRDITIRAVAEGLDFSDTTARDIMTHDMEWCFEDETTEEASRIMRERGVRRLAVMNRDKRIVGVVSLGDLSAESPELAGEALRTLSAGHGKKDLPPFRYWGI